LPNEKKFMARLFTRNDPEGGHTGDDFDSLEEAKEYCESYIFLGEASKIRKVKERLDRR
jgi:hypothetical protein